MSAIDKAKIIEAINNTDDEFVLTTINQLLQTDNHILDWHIKELQKRLKNMDEGKTIFLNWDDVKNSIFKS
jgi:hypothetical protein